MRAEESLLFSYDDVIEFDQLTIPNLSSTSYVSVTLAELIINDDSFRLDA